MEIEEVGFNPENLAKAVHHQLDSKTGPVPVTAIAAALDIINIRYEPLESFEGALVMPASRNRGVILVNSLVSTKRQRFTIAHELGHYLNLRHVPVSDQGFECTERRYEVLEGFICPDYKSTAGT